MARRAPTIEDVARAAGVSVATVSRALRGLPNVAPATRERVQFVAGQLHYRPDPSASALAAGRTRTIAMAVPLLDSWYFSQVMAGAEAVVAEAGYDLLLFTVEGDEQRQRLLGGPLVKRADGLILVDLMVPDDEASELVAGDVPVVSVGIAVAGASSVMVDDFALAKDAVGHLFALGHRKIALIEGLSGDPQRFPVPIRRREGYLAGLSDAGLEMRPEYLAAGEFSVQGGRGAMAALLDTNEPPTAVFVMSDELAFGALNELWRRGLNAPEDVSLIGVDDHEFSEVVGLTTIHQEVSRHGAMAASILLEALQSAGGELRHHLAATELKQRSTTAPPGRSSPWSGQHPKGLGQRATS